MRRIHIVVAYDGTDFCGFAAQSERRTVQGTLTETVRRITGEENEIIGASRTDSGAHAQGQSIHFDCNAGVPIEKWTSVLNRALPQDLRAVSAREAEPDFHARFCADYRQYQYRVLLKTDDPFRARFCQIESIPLDITAMQKAAKCFVGTHDFKSFTQELDPSVLNTVRTLHQVEVAESEDELHINIRGDAFLRGMMRRISGFLMEVGKEQRSAEDIHSLLDPNSCDLQLPIVLPAKGLCLQSVGYKNPPVDCRTRSNGFSMSEDVE